MSDTSHTRERGAAKVARIPVKVEPTLAPARKPKWIRAKSPNHPEVVRLKQILRKQKLHTVCEEASCPNLGECFGHGTATFMILGDVCTRRCPFCDVAHGKPQPPDAGEPANLAETIEAMGLRFVVITSVDRDDLRDGGASHFADCIEAVRTRTPDTGIEILVPDFRGRLEVALELLARYKEQVPSVPTKSGLMLGLGEELDEVEQVMRELRDHGCDMLTLGQYLQPSLHHLPVSRFVTPEEFDRLAELGRAMGFSHVASGPMVRSSYHADAQARGARGD